MVASPAPPLEDRSLVDGRVRLMRNGIIFYAGSLISGLAGLVVVPVLLKGLGAEAYGLWIAVMALVGSATVLDFGLNLSLRREIAAAETHPTKTGLSGAADFVASTGMVYVVTGFIGAIAIATLGLPLSGMLHLAPEVKAIAHSIFLLGGVYFFFQHLTNFASYVLQGLQRFKLVTILNSSVTVLRAGGVIALIWAGAKLPGVAAWMAATTAVGAVAALIVVVVIDARYRLRLFRWEVLRKHLGYGLTGSGTNLIMKLLTETGPPLLIGGVLGSSAIVPYYLGLKFPQAVRMLVTSSAEVMFSTAARESSHRERLKEFLFSSTRWMVVLVTAPCLMVAIVAPNLLQVWLGLQNHDALMVLRIMAAYVFMEAVGEGAYNVLWAEKQLRTVVWIWVTMAVVVFAAAFAGVHRWGLLGAVLGFALVPALGSSAFLVAAAKLCGASVGAVSRSSLRGILFPVALSGIVTWSAVHWMEPHGWAGIAGVVISGSLAYLISFYYLSAHEAERIFAGEIISFPVSLARMVTARRPGA